MGELVSHRSLRHYGYGEVNNNDYDLQGTEYWIWWKPLGDWDKIWTFICDSNSPFCPWLKKVATQFRKIGETKRASVFRTNKIPSEEHISYFTFEYCHITRTEMFALIFPSSESFRIKWFKKPNGSRYEMQETSVGSLLKTKSSNEYCSTWKRVGFPIYWKITCCC